LATSSGEVALAGSNENPESEHGGAERGLDRKDRQHGRRPDRTGAAGVDMSKHRRHQENRRGVADDDHDRAPYGRVRDERDRQIRRVVAERVKHQRRDERHQTVGYRGRDDDRKRRDAQEGPRDPEGDAVGRELRERVLRRRYRQRQHEEMGLLLALRDDAERGREDAQKQNRDEQNHPADEELGLPERQQRNADSADDERADHHRPQKVKVLGDQPANDRCAHSPRSLRLAITFATKISSSVMRCTSHTFAPARSYAAAISGVYRFTVATASCPVRARSMTPGSAGRSAQAGATRCNRRQRSRKVSLSLDSTIAPRSMNVMQSEIC